MPTNRISDTTPGDEIFPQFAGLYALVASEVIDLSNTHLDWSSSTWEWSKWSIKQQVSHMGSFLPGWLLRRWGNQLFPDGLQDLGQLAEYKKSDKGWWLDEERYPNLSDLLQKLQDGLNLAQQILSTETLGSLRTKEEPRPDTPPHWAWFADAHPTGIRWHESIPNFTYISLEATFRHLYFEVITHLYNIQRIKKAQNLHTVVIIPMEGYLVLPNWDTSEP